MEEKQVLELVVNKLEIKLVEDDYRFYLQRPDFKGRDYVEISEEEFKIIAETLNYKKYVIEYKDKYYNYSHFEIKWNTKEYIDNYIDTLKNSDSIYNLKIEGGE